MWLTRTVAGFGTCLKEERPFAASVRVRPYRFSFRVEKKTSTNLPNHQHTDDDLMSKDRVCVMYDF